MTRRGFTGRILLRPIWPQARHTLLAEERLTRHRGSITIFLAVLGQLCCADWSVGSPNMLLVLGASDPAALRAAIAAETGGAVDYFDARSGTPTAEQLLAYDCVFASPYEPFFEPFLLGNRLADYVDAGGRVSVGAYATLPGWLIEGRLSVDGYLPVYNPTSGTRSTVSAYAGDGTGCIHDGVTAYAAALRERPVLIGAGEVQSRFADGDIAVAFQPAHGVYFLNAVAFHAQSTGEWPRLIARTCACGSVGVGESPAFTGLYLAPLRPNPGSAGPLEFSFRLARGGDVSWEIVDPSGRRVWNGRASGLSAGNHSARWGGESVVGAPAPPGVYFLRVWSAGETRTARFVRL